MVLLSTASWKLCLGWIMGATCSQVWFRGSRRHTDRHGSTRPSAASPPATYRNPLSTATVSTGHRLETLYTGLEGSFFTFPDYRFRLYFACTKYMFYLLKKTTLWQIIGHFVSVSTKTLYLHLISYVNICKYLSWRMRKSLVFSFNYTDYFVIWEYALYKPDRV